ncbi:MAG: UDP-N-acetylmuramoyl-L-alanine--D-glutamate ligase [Acidobacteriales bacterium]|nr:UDP-N-acetylmuramoyl-L-alanine--D-glutamate ligase [Terriglobales bacterium]
MDLTDKRALVVGLGKSGVAAALFLKARGARVTVSDSKPAEELRQQIAALLDAGISVETGHHGERTFREQDLIVVSPGVPSDSPPLVQARALGETVIGEVELATRFLPGKLIAITGSNGKTTTTTLIGEVVAASGVPTLVGGNIGTPAISLVKQAGPDTVTVLEVSSFQLETIQSFHPKVSVILNVTPDHLDRHRTFAAYADTKAQIFRNQGSDDYVVLNADDPTCVELGGRATAPVFWFSRRKKVERGASVRQGQILFRGDAGLVEISPISEIALKGTHNLENVLAAVCTGCLLGCSPESLRRVIANFKAVEHRLEYVATVDGVEYYNDSKATNVDATIKALESFPGNIHLILGGKDKGSDYSVLADLLRRRVRGVYTIGAAANKIEDQIGDAAPVIRAQTLTAAVERAAAAARAGDVVLLAPACASFDQFESYEHRGRVFKELVGELAAKTQAAGS